MSRKNWKRPRSLRHGIEMCLSNAKEKHNRSVEGVAEIMGLESHWALYKWQENGRMPAVLIPAFEAACGCDYVSNWLATRGGKLIIPMPSGRNMKPTDINALQAALHNTVGALMEFYEGKQKLSETLEAINQGLESLAWHKGNVEQHSQPQLELDDEN